VIDEQPPVEENPQAKKEKKKKKHREADAAPEAEEKLTVSNNPEIQPVEKKKKKKKKQKKNLSTLEHSKVNVSTSANSKKDNEPQVSKETSKAKVFSTHSFVILISFDFLFSHIPFEYLGAFTISN
jgi:hypothetical protein